MTDNQLIFLSYASPDRDRVMEFHDYSHVVKLMKKEVAHALGVEHLTRDLPRWPFGTEAEQEPDNR